MAWLCDTAELVPSGWLSSLYAGHGVRGDAVPSSGTDGPSALYPCLSLPADAAVEVRGYITRWPALGTLEIAEDGSFVYAGATDYFEFRLYADGVASSTDIGFGPGIVRVGMAVGATSAFGAGAVLASTTAAGTLSGAAAGTFGAGASLARVVASGTLAGAVVSAFGSGAALGPVLAGGRLTGRQIAGAPRTSSRNTPTTRRPANLARS